MPDLDAAIRARLDEFCESDMCAEVGKAALLAVLDLHGPHPDDPSKCRCALEYDDLCTAHAVPCPTVRVIAEKLGVGVDGARG